MRRRRGVRLRASRGHSVDLDQLLVDVAGELLLERERLRERRAGAAYTSAANAAVTDQRVACRQAPTGGAWDVWVAYHSVRRVFPGTAGKFLLARKLALPFLPVAIGAVCGASASYYTL